VRKRFRAQGIRCKGEISNFKFIIINAFFLGPCALCLAPLCDEFDAYREAESPCVIIDTLRR